MNCLTEYTNKNIKFYNFGKNEIYMGTNLKLSELLQYERKKGKITFPNFTIFYEKFFEERPKNAFFHLNQSF